MKCFSLAAQNLLVSSAYAGMYPRGGVTYVVDAYPKPKAGFELDPTERALKVGFVEKVAASDELLRLPADSGAITRDGKHVKVLRASIRNDGGKPVLIPEQAEDTRNALVYIDVGSGHHTFVRYQTAAEQLVAHSRIDGEPYQERILVVLKPFEPVTAVRSSQKWIFWGEERVKEILTIMFDGENIFYDIKRPERKR